MNKPNLLDLFIWPATRFARENTLSEQVAHVISEVDEVAQVMPVDLPTRSGPAIPADVLPVFQKLADLHHSLETLWRVLAGLYGWDAVREIFYWVWMKNQERGYYAEDRRGEVLGTVISMTAADRAQMFPTSTSPGALTVSFMLTLAGIEVPEEVIAEWSAEQMGEAADWAAAVHLAAFDHDYINVPARPEFLNLYLTQTEAK